MVLIAHAFVGPPQSHFEQVVVIPFNTTHDYYITTESTNNLTFVVEDSLLKLIQKDPSKPAPNLLQVSEYMTRQLMGRKITIPIGNLLSAERLDDIHDVVKRTMSDNQNQLQSLPFNPACGVLYINRTALRKGGYPDDYVPKTFEEIKTVSQELINQGIVKEGWTSAWVAAYLFEIRKAQQGLPVALPGNALDGQMDQFCCNKEDDIAFFRDLKKQQQAHIYAYKGNYSNSKDSFCAGDMAFYMQGANQSEAIYNDAKIEIDVAPMPAYGPGTKYMFPMGGASFWVLDNIEDKVEEVKAVLNHLSDPEVQIEWHKRTFYVPVSKTAIARLKEEGFYNTHPIHRAVIEQTLESPTCEYSFGNRIPNYEKIREEVVNTIKAFLDSQDDDPTPYLNALAEKAKVMAGN